MYVIVVTSRKGGAGKTTVAAHLGVEIERAGDGPVALVDLDEQGSLAGWWNARKGELPRFAQQVKIANLSESLEALKGHGIKIVLIDTPPGMGRETQVALEKILPYADLALIPTRPSPLDLRAIGRTVELVEGADKRMVFVINGAANRARITGDAAVALSQHGTVAPVTLYQRTDFASSMIDGRTAQEIDPESKSATEIADLWKYVSKHLRK